MAGTTYTWTGNLRHIVWYNATDNVTEDVSGTDVALPGAGGGITDIIQDTTPQLGGNLDLQAYTISGTAILDLQRTATDNFVMRMRSTSPYQNQYMVMDGDGGVNRKQLVMKLESSIDEAAITTQAQGAGTAPPLYLRSNGSNCIKLNTDQSTLFYRLVDMSNVDMEIDSVGTTRADRFKIKNRNANQNTTLHITPDGTATNTYLELCSAEDLANTGTFYMAIEDSATAASIGTSQAGTGTAREIQIKPGNTKKFTFELDGTLSSADLTYETLVTADDDIPNKKYVDDGIASDARLKQNIERLTGALDKVSQLHGYTFEMIDKPGERKTGVIAQEVEAVLPEAITYRATQDGTDEYRVVAYGNMAGLLIEAINELKAEVDGIKAHLGL